MDAERPLVGFTFYFTAVTLMAVTDATAKWLSADYPVGQLVFLRSVCGLALIAPFVLRAGCNNLRTKKIWIQIIRGICMLAAMTLLYMSVKYVPLAEVATLLSTEPLFVIVLSIFLLKEEILRSSVVAVAGGFLGASLVVGSEHFSAGIASLLPLGSAFAAALVMIITRYLSRSDHSMSTVLCGYVVVAIGSGATIPFAWVTPAFADWWVILSLGVVSSGAVYCFVEGCRHAPINRLTPLEYTRIAWGAVLGFVIWHEVPGIWTWVGAALIVGAGVYTMWGDRAVEAAVK